MTFDLEQYRNQIGDWIIRDHATIRRFELKQESILNDFFMAAVYCEARELPMFAFGLDLREKVQIEEQMTHVLTQVENDSVVSEGERDIILRSLQWHRSLYRWAIDGHLAKAIQELKAVGARQISHKPAR